MSFTVRLAIVVQRAIQSLQQAANRFTSNLELLALQLFDQLARRLMRPFRATDWVAGGRVLQQPAQRYQDLGSLF